MGMMKRTWENATECNECGCTVTLDPDGWCPACGVLEQYGTLEVDSDGMGGQERRELARALDAIH